MIPKILITLAFGFIAALMYHAMILHSFSYHQKGTSGWVRHFFLLFVRYAFVLLCLLFILKIASFCPIWWTIGFMVGSICYIKKIKGTDESGNI
jgi:hypothetical protein